MHTLCSAKKVLWRKRFSIQNYFYIAKQGNIFLLEDHARSARRETNENNDVLTASPNPARLDDVDMGEGRGRTQQHVSYNFDQDSRFRVSWNNRINERLSDKALEGAVASWSDPAGSWCQKLNEVGVRAPAMVASQPEWTARLVNLLLRLATGAKYTISPSPPSTD